MCLRPRADGSPEKVGKMSETVNIGYTGPERDRNSQVEKLRMYVHLLESEDMSPTKFDGENDRISAEPSSWSGPTSAETLSANHVQRAVTRSHRLF